MCGANASRCRVLDVDVDGANGVDHKPHAQNVVVICFELPEFKGRMRGNATHCPLLMGFFDVLTKWIRTKTEIRFLDTTSNYPTTCDNTCDIANEWLVAQ